MKGYIEIDEFSDVEASLLSLSVLLPHLSGAPLIWKNVILNVHSALQSACVCLLTRTDGSGALDKQTEKACRDYYEATSRLALGETPTGAPAKFPEATQTGNLPNLLKALPEPLRAYHADNLAACTSLRERDLANLHDFRNQFTHFMSTTWWIEEAGLPRICLTALELVDGIRTSNQWRRYSRFSQTRVAELLPICQKHLREFQCA